MSFWLSYKVRKYQRGNEIFSLILLGKNVRYYNTTRDAQSSLEPVVAPGAIFKLKTGKKVGFTPKTMLLL